MVKALFVNTMRRELIRDGTSKKWVKINAGVESDGTQTGRILESQLERSGVYGRIPGVKSFSALIA
jgi:hypothetical protein